MKFVKTKQHEEMGQYIPTSLDVEKSEVDFLIVNCNSNWFTIDVRNENLRNELKNNIEHTNGNFEIKKKTFGKIKTRYTWKTNF